MPAEESLTAEVERGNTETIVEEKAEDAMDNANANAKEEGLPTEPERATSRQGSRGGLLGLALRRPSSNKVFPSLPSFRSAKPPTTKPEKLVLIPEDEKDKDDVVEKSNTCERLRRSFFTTVYICYPLLLIPIYFTYHALVTSEEKPLLAASLLQLAHSDKLATNLYSLKTLIMLSSEDEPIWRFNADPDTYNLTQMIFELLEETEDLFLSLTYDIQDRLAWKQNEPHHYELLFVDGCKNTDAVTCPPGVDDDIVISDLDRGVVYALENALESFELWKQNRSIIHPLPYRGLKALEAALKYNGHVTFDAVVHIVEAKDAVFQISFVVFIILFAFTSYYLYHGFKRLSRQLRDAHQIVLLIPNTAIEASPALKALLNVT